MTTGATASARGPRPGFESGGHLPYWPHFATAARDCNGLAHQEVGHGMCGWTTCWTTSHAQLCLHALFKIVSRCSWSQACFHMCRSRLTRPRPYRRRTVGLARHRPKPGEPEACTAACARRGQPLDDGQQEMAAITGIAAELFALAVDDALLAVHRAAVLLCVDNARAPVSCGRLLVGALVVIDCAAALRSPAAGGRLPSGPSQCKCVPPLSSRWDAGRGCPWGSSWRSGGGTDCHSLEGSSGVLVVEGFGWLGQRPVSWAPRLWAPSVGPGFGLPRPSQIAPPA